MNSSPKGVTYPQGFTASGVSCGIKDEKGTRDLALIYSENPATAAGTFTTNAVKAAPVLHTREKIKGGRLQAVVANSGNANACTGSRGRQDAAQMAEWSGRALNLDPGLVGVCSTGIIGHPLPMAKIETGIRTAASKLDRNGGQSASRAIMTTDTIPKVEQASFTTGEGQVNIGGMAKGAGMICPDMATMLAFITTDARISEELLDCTLTQCVDKSFNTLTVDGDMSTNDTVLILANGMSNTEIKEGTEAHDRFVSALLEVTQNLAKKIAADGEGATTLIEVKIVGAASSGEAKKIGKQVANSSLVKTAIFGRDPNWGRIMAAAGSAGVDFDPDRVEVYLGDLCVFRGCGIEFDPKQAAEILAEDEVEITVNLNRGESRIRIWTCDLTPDYIDVNSLYST